MTVNLKPDVESRQRQRIVSIVEVPTDQIPWTEQIQKRISFDSQHLSKIRLVCVSLIELIQLQYTS